MRVSGRKLRLAVGAGITALMLTLGVSSVGATAPGAVGNVNVVVTSSGASAAGSPNTTVTVANYRDAVVITNTLSGAGGLAGNYDECVYAETGSPSNSGTVQQPAGNTSSTDITPGLSCGNVNPIIQPAAYPLWEVQTGTQNSNTGSKASTVLVVPPTTVPANGTVPAKTYVIETFR